VSEFKILALKQLTDQQVRFAPPARRKEQVARAEKLLGEVEPARQYPYPFVCFRITDYRSNAHADLLIPGNELQHDLLLFVKRLERSIPAMPIEQSVEPMLTLEEISKRFNVSTKTISRWRAHGLVGQRVLVKGRRQIAFPQSVVEQFLTAHQERVERSGRFSHLTDAEKEDILRRAGRLSRAGGCLTEISKRIARKLGRSVETVRYTIKNFDREHPDKAIFPDATGPLDGETRETIANSFRKGTPVQTLANQYSRTRTSVYRVINESRADRLVKQPVDYIHNETFDDPTKDAEYLAPMPGEDKFKEAHRGMKPPRDVPPELASLYEWPLLTKDQEQHQFRLMNYLKHKLSKLRQSIDPASVRVGQLRQIEELQCKINTVKERLINCNMRLVASIAKKHANQADSLFELISDGNLSLMRAVEKFDYARGNKFSTYASWAIMKNFARSIPDEKHHRERYLTGHEDLFDAKADVRTDESEVVAQAEMARSRVSNLLDGLDARTRDVIRMRNGLDGSEALTLEQIGQHFGITKERVRQINVRGMKMLKEKAMAAKADLP
jgi:RNA polymerase sigma factor (sigma-70 family)